MRALLPLAACLALACGSKRPDVQSECAVAVGLLELCGPDCAAALEAVRAGCAAVVGGLPACQVVGTVVQIPAPGGATLPSAPPGATPTPSASRDP